MIHTRTHGHLVSLSILFFKKKINRKEGGDTGDRERKRVREEKACKGMLVYKVKVNICVFVFSNVFPTK